MKSELGQDHVTLLVQHAALHTCYVSLRIQLSRPLSRRLAAWRGYASCINRIMLSEILDAQPYKDHSTVRLIKVVWPSGPRRLF